MKTLEVFPVSGRGNVHIVELDRDLASHDELTGKEVELDGKVVTVRGMEWWAIARPPKKGERVGLLV